MQEIDLRYDSFYKIIKIIACVIALSFLVALFPKYTVSISAATILFISIAIIINIKNTAYFIRKSGSFIQTPILARDLKIVSFVEPSYVPNTWYGIEGTFKTALTNGRVIHSNTVAIFPSHVRTRELPEAEQTLSNLTNQKNAFLDQKNMVAYLDISIPPKIDKDLHGLTLAVGILWAIAATLVYLQCAGQ